MAPNTRSSSNSKTLSPNPLSSPTDTTTVDENVPPPRRFDGIDLFAHLRTDERRQETQFNVKPPQLPKKVQTQGYWEVKPRDTKNLPYSSEYVRALEQAANRLVAKAKELVVVYEGDEDKYKKPIMEAEEMCIDTIDMLEADMDRKKYRQKWTANKATWKNDYPNWKFDE